MGQAAGLLIKGVEMDMYYIVSVISGDGKHRDCYNICSNESKSKATNEAIEAFRRENDMKIDEAVIARVIYESSDPQRASEFYEQLFEKEA